MRLILLAAGHGYALDGMVKCLLKHPQTGKTFIEHAIEAFPNYKPTVVVGYRAVEIMQQYPNLHYIYNHDWAVTSNSYSLGMALSDEPCYVCSSDMLYPPELITEATNARENIVITSRNENRTLTAINCILSENRVIETYMGPLKDISHPESVGIFKISSPEILKTWRQNCLKHGNLFVGQNLPFSMEYPPIYAMDKGDNDIFEVNTPLDYHRLIQSLKQET